VTQAARDRVRVGAAAAGLGLAALALSVAVAGAGIGHWEVSTVDGSVDTPAVIGEPARAVMQLGTRAAMLVIALAVAVTAHRWRGPLAIVLAWGLAWLATNRAKAIIERPRPDPDLWRDTPGGWGYPSGHTSSAFAVATVVAALLPGRWRWVPFALAAVVGFARMYVGVHYPMDLIGGALIGLAAGLTAIAVLGPLRPLGRFSPFSPRRS
jgi:membrane-associated phospholipid phosphatase